MKVEQGLKLNNNIVSMLNFPSVIITSGYVNKYSYSYIC